MMTENPRALSGVPQASGVKLGWFLPPLLAALAVKAWLIVSGWVPFNADEAVVALMARHILQGERPIFFYGQAYMGSLDALLIAGGFALFGQQVWVIRLVQTLLYLGLLATTAWLARLIFHSWRAGIVSLWLLAVPAVNVMLYTTASLGGYGEALLIGNLILIGALRIGDILERGAVCPPWMLLCWGFLAGLGLWVFGLTLVYSVPAGIYLGYRLWEKNGSPLSLRNRLSPWGAAGLILAGGALGAVPWWVYGFKWGFDRLVGELGGGAIAGVAGAQGAAGLWHHFTNFLLLGVSVILGLRAPWDVNWLILPLIPFVLLFWLAVIRFILRRLMAVDSGRGKYALLAGVMLTLVGGFILTPFGLDPSGRYFLPLAVPLALFAADMLLSLHDRYGPKIWLLLSLILVYHLAGMLQSVLRSPARMTTQFYSITHIDHSFDRALMAFLEAHGETRGYTNYWVAYPLAFLSQEELIFVPRLPYHSDFRYTERDDRYPAYSAMVSSAARVAYITTRHPALDATLVQRFEQEDITWQEAQIGDYHVFYALSRPVYVNQIGMGVSRPRGYP